MPFVETKNWQLATIFGGIFNSESTFRRFGRISLRFSVVQYETMYSQTNNQNHQRRMPPPASDFNASGKGKEIDICVYLLEFIIQLNIHIDNLIQSMLFMQKCFLSLSGCVCDAQIVCQNDIRFRYFHSRM